MSIFGWIFFGFIVGLIARGIMPGREPIGLIGTTILGIMGSLIAGLFGQAVGWYRPDQAAGFVAATFGAVSVLSVYYLVSRNRRTAVSSTLHRKKHLPEKHHRAA